MFRLNHASKGPTRPLFTLARGQLSRRVLALPNHGIFITMDRLNFIRIAGFTALHGSCLIALNLVVNLYRSAHYRDFYMFGYVFIRH